MSNRETRRALAPEDLAYIAERARALDPYIVHPWDRNRLWAAVLVAQMSATTRAECEAVAEARGALQILDAIERHFVRRE
ncbi:hypothetical protein WME90_36345 [Sorangium sp. So ce375]|uniref:hypothetical protein n=1 Tax=Sorangium sp. So ce375 TaxID=3133306 RepID=UPI003F5BE459